MLDTSETTKGGIVEVDTSDIPSIVPGEEKIIASVKKKWMKATTKKRSVTAEATRDRLMRMGRLSHAVKVLHASGLCGGCRLPKKYCRCGPKHAMDETALSKYEVAFKCGMSVADACIHVGISQKTYYQFEKAHPEWTELRKEWQSEPERLARQKVVGEIEKDTKVAQWWLEKKKRDEFGRDESFANGPAQVKINLIGMYSLDGEEAPKIIAAEVISDSPALLDNPTETNEEKPTKTESTESDSEGASA